ncbi:hypothetical protein EV182_002358 [Spiromyces aspiralis]|uniref:Uncharacterized protein n=1 Tax=Spiromyces aspiralis TaxID=68401 RepID=A0ACC1HVB7_9FUNG|nr:hypothetical protein EV182_002358 [Spiromyces aspiralis]
MCPALSLAITGDYPPRHDAVGRQQYLFDDRVEAAYRLADALDDYAGRSDTILLSVSRGGAVVGKVLSERLGLPYYPLPVKLIEHPDLPHLHIGSMSAQRQVILEDEIVRGMQLSKEKVDGLLDQAWEWLQREQARYNIEVPQLTSLEGKTIVLVDDLIDSGDLMRNTVSHIKKGCPGSKVVVATPVCLADNKRRLSAQASISVLAPSACVPSSSWFKLGPHPSEMDAAKLHEIYHSQDVEFGE